MDGDATVRALRQAAELGIEYLENLPERHVGARTDAATLAAELGGPVPDEPTDPVRVIEELTATVDPGLVASAGPRYFGFVVGGAVPASAAADWLATTCRRRVSRVLLVTYLLTAMMGFAFILYSDVGAQDLLLYVFLALFAIGVAVNGLARRREWHRKYIDYRALAEGLRVQSYWRRAGIVDSSRPSFAHDNFLQKQDVELGWIRNVMRGASVDGMLVPVSGGQDGIEAVMQEWIGAPGAPGQLDYYLTTSEKRARQHGRSEILATICLWLGISLSLLLAVLARLLEDQVQNLMVAAMGALSVAAAVHEAYSYKKADKELIKQYRFMARIFTAARRRLAQSRGAEQQRQILRTLGEAALAEHAEWTLMHRERPLEHSKL